jgi:hypothetical protein
MVAVLLLAFAQCPAKQGGFWRRFLKKPRLPQEIRSGRLSRRREGQNYPSAATLMKSRSTPARRKFAPLPLLAAMCLFIPLIGRSDERVPARDGSGILGYKNTPVLPWCGFHVHDPDRPAPPRVDPGPPLPAAPVPADAVVLFGGKDLSAWEEGRWRVVDSLLEAGEGSLRSRQEFGDMQLHMEWMAPADFKGPWHDRGNNGVLLMGLYEIQIFDSHGLAIYPDGQAAAIYGQTPPLVNVTRPAGQWQSFDVFFTAPRFKEGRLLAPARVTMLHNGVLVHLDEEIRGETRHLALPENRRQIERGPVVLHGHNCPVRFRNIWVRPLPPRAGADPLAPE